MNAALLGTRVSPQLLISVCTLDEAKMAQELGADIIDLKIRMPAPWVHCRWRTSAASSPT